jgi:hypothetical protein
MYTSLSEEIAEKSLSAKSTAETETGDQTEQDDPKLPAKAEHRAEKNQILGCASYFKFDQ